MKDRLAVADSIEGGITKEVVPPRHPCSICGRETLEHTPRLPLESILDDGLFPIMGMMKQRICSAPTCRHVQDES